MMHRQILEIESVSTIDSKPNRIQSLQMPELVVGIKDKAVKILKLDFALVLPGTLILKIFVDIEDVDPAFVTMSMDVGEDPNVVPAT